MNIQNEFSVFLFYVGEKKIKVLNKNYNEIIEMKSMLVTKLFYLRFFIIIMLMQKWHRGILDRNKETGSIG